MHLNDFLVYINSTDSEPIYSAAGVEFTTGVYEIVLEPEVSASAIIIKRPTGPDNFYITLCEVEVFLGE